MTTAGPGRPADQDHLTVLVTATSPDVRNPLVEELRARGHDAVSCPRLPRCTGMGGVECAVEDGTIDVACTWRSDAYPWPAAGEIALACAVRGGIPVVVAGRTTPNPFDVVPGTAVDVPVDDTTQLAAVVDACEAVRRGRRPVRVRRLPSANEVINMAVRSVTLQTGDVAPAWFLLAAGCDKLVLAEAAIICGRLVRQEPGNRVLKDALEVIQTTIFGLFDHADVVDLRTASSQLAGVAPPVRVLLVEDDPVYGRLVDEMLTFGGDGFVVERCETLSAALGQLARIEVTVIVAAVDLPDSGGAHTVRALHRAAPNALIVALLSQVGDDAIGAVRAGADECIDKGRLAVENLGTMIRLAVVRRHREIEEATSGSGSSVAVRNLAALSNVGGFLVSLASRVRMHIAVLVVELADGDADQANDILEMEALLGGCARSTDFIARSGPAEISVVAVADGPEVSGAVTRLREEVARSATARHRSAKFGAVIQDPLAWTTFPELLDAAREGAGFVAADGTT